MAELDLVYEKLLAYLEIMPVKQKSNFKIEAVNNGAISINGLMDNSALKMDQVNIDSSVETRWTIQNKSIQFVIYKGDVDLHFRLNENVHVKHLSVTQSLRIPLGIPFMLKTFEKNCSVLLISATEDKNE